MSYEAKTIIWDGQGIPAAFVGRQRVLVVGPASPSTGGIPSYIDDLLTSGLKDRFLLGLLDPLVVKGRYEKQQSHFSIKEAIAGLRVIKRFVEALRRFDPALVHIHTSSYWGFYEKAVLLLIAKFIFRKRTILHIHGGEFDLFYQRSYCRRGIDAVMKMADRTLIVSKKFSEIVGASNEEILVVDNSVRFSDELLAADKQGLRDKHSIARGKTVFISAAILEKRKGIRETLDAFKKILSDRDDFLFIVAGEGPERDNIITFVELNGLGKNVKVLNFISGREKEDILLLSDVFILNSSNESFGISLIEAVSHGLFVISTPVGIASDSEDVFKKGNCIRVPVGDRGALEEAILRVLDKDVDIEKVKLKSFLNFKERFDVVPVFEKMRLIYEEVLAVRGQTIPHGGTQDD